MIEAMPDDIRPIIHYFPNKKPIHWMGEKVTHDAEGVTEFAFTAKDSKSGLVRRVSTPAVVMTRMTVPLFLPWGSIANWGPGMKTVIIGDKDPLVVAAARPRKSAKVL